MTTPPRCPKCAQPLFCDALGLRCAHADTCSIGIDETVQEYDDRARSGTRSTLAPQGYDDPRSLGRYFTRALTRAERVLLAAAGADAVAINRATCHVTYFSPPVRRRSFSTVTVSELPGMPTADPGVVR